MKTMLVAIFLNLSNGTRTTVEVPMKSFDECLKAEKLQKEQPVPEGYRGVVKCIVGAE